MTDETGRPEFDPAIDLVGEADFWLGASRVSPSMREVARAGLQEAYTVGGGPDCTLYDCIGRSFRLGVRFHD
jgi:hypothetical protein